MPTLAEVLDQFSWMTCCVLDLRQGLWTAPMMVLETTTFALAFTMMMQECDANKVATNNWITAINRLNIWGNEQLHNFIHDILQSTLRMDGVSINNNAKRNSKHNIHYSIFQRNSVRAKKKLNYWQVITACCWWWYSLIRLGTNLQTSVLPHLCMHRQMICKHLFAVHIWLGKCHPHLSI